MADRRLNVVIHTNVVLDPAVVEARNWGASNL